MTSFPSTIIANITMDDVYYQVTGMAVVFACLIFLSLILTVSGGIAVKMEQVSKASAAAAKAAADAAALAAAPATASAAAAAEMSPAEVAALAAGIYNTARSNITPEVVAAIAAAVRVTLGSEQRILAIKPVNPSFAHGGRAAIMNSHFPKKG